MTNIQTIIKLLFLKYYLTVILKTCNLMITLRYFRHR